MSKIRHGALIAWLSLLLAGCATDRSFGLAPDIQITDLTELPMPDRVEAVVVRPLESLEVNVLQDEDLSGTYLVDERGVLAFPYVGDIDVTGLTPNQVADTIRRGLAGGYLVDPDVTVRPTTTREARTVSLGGQVASPGEFPLSSARTLLRAVNLAGGTGSYAAKDDVLIMREVDGARYIGVYNLRAIERGNYRDPQLAPNDIVMVGESTAARRFANIIQYLPLLTTAVILRDLGGF